jgi:hypothetical protein
MSGPKPFGERVVRSMTDPKVFGRHFLPAESWGAWVTLLSAIFALELNGDAITLFEKATGRSKQFAIPVTEALLLIGRRAGKSRILALVATALAVFRDYSQYLAPGERAIVMVLASDRDQAQVIFRYTRALLVETPSLKGLIERETADELILTNGVTIGIYTSSYRAVRGRTLAAALCDEICFWRDDTSRDPASAVLQALRPALSTIPGSLLLCASSVYARSGIAYEMFSKHWGQNASKTLIWKLGTLEMNPSFKVETIEAARLEDAAAAASEYDSEFRQDVSGFLLDADIDSAIDRGIRSRPLSLRFTYHAFCDMSGGRSDAATLAIAHFEYGRIVVDRIEVAEAPHDPTVVTARFADVLSGYALSRLVGDAYAGEWVPSAFAKHRIAYVASDLSKSEIFLECLPLFTSGMLSLPDHQKLEAELRQLERRPRTAGRDAIGHVRGGHDDVANSCLGAASLVSRFSSNTGDADSNNITHALRDHDPLAERVEVRQARHLPPDFAIGIYEPDYARSLRDHEIF